ncbi:hypothetical protein KCP76_22175 [Salmonella enterica subsp. enterica serovar Weltevreden]|nr:hypothetical protein KCP76_22175 [Salmonella enterica subsp. enterica serovar Weltevreden]
MVKVANLTLIMEIPDSLTGGDMCAMLEVIAMMSQEYFWEMQASFNDV